MSEITFCASRKDIPENIMAKIDYSANVFFSEEYYNYIISQKSNIIYYISKDYIIPLSVHINHGFKQGSFLSEMFFYSDGEDTPCKRKAFINSVVSFIEQTHAADWINITPAYTFFDVYPDKSKRIRFGSHVIDLTLDEETLLSNMTSKHRNMVRRAQRDGITVKFGGLDLLDEYCELDKRTWERSGVSSSNRGIYEEILKHLKNSSFIAIAYKDDVPQSGMLCYYNKAMMYYMFAASCNSPSPGATNLLHWEVMLEMKRRNVEKYSFVGCRINEDPDSKYHSIQHFKKGFGGELKEGYLFKCDISGFKHNIFKTLLRLKTGKKDIDAIDQEMPKWEDIN